MQGMLLSLSLSHDASQQFPVSVGKSQFIKLLPLLSVLVKLCTGIQTLPKFFACFHGQVAVCCSHAIVFVFFFVGNYFLSMRDGCSWVSIACRGIKSWMLQMRSQVSAKTVPRGFIIYCDTGSFHGCFGLLLYFPQGFPCCSKGCICFACGASKGV